MVRDFATLIGAAVQNELARQLGITHDTVEWAMSALAVKISPLIAAARKSPGCSGCTA